MSRGPRRAYRWNDSSDDVEELAECDYRCWNEETKRRPEIDVDGPKRQVPVFSETGVVVVLEDVGRAAHNGHGNRDRQDAKKEAADPRARGMLEVCLFLSRRSRVAVIEEGRQGRRRGDLQRCLVVGRLLAGAGARARACLRVSRCRLPGLRRCRAAASGTPSWSRVCSDVEV